MQPLFWSRLVLNAATLGTLSGAQYDKFHGAFLRVTHLVANAQKEDYADPLVNSRALVRLRIPPLHEILKLMRLSFPPRLLKWAPCMHHVAHRGPCAVLLQHRVA